MLVGCLSIFSNAEGDVISPRKHYFKIGHVNRILIISQLLLSISLCSYGQTNPEALFKSLIKTHDIPGISVAIINDGKVVYQNGHGVKSSDTGEPVDDETVFSAASLSKQVFAYAVMKLVESGDLELDKPLFQYWEYEDLQHEERYKSITARMVLSHSSGLPNWRRDQLNLKYDPGQRFSYSGEGYVFLGKVIEHLQQKEIGEVVEELVFQPLKMKNSSFHWEDRFEANYAAPHDFMAISNPKRKRTKTNVAASLQTTAGDYAKLILALVNHSDLKKTTIEEMFTEQVVVPGATNLHWGLGWGIQQTGKGKAIWQWGDNYTYKAFTMTYLDGKRGIVYLTNSQNGLRMVSEVVRFLMDDKCPACDWMDYDTEDLPYQALLRSVLEKGYEAAIIDYLNEAKNHHDTQLIRQWQMARVGYRLMRERRFDDAKKVYRLNIEAYESYDTYVQYAACCMRSGDFEEAKTNYLKAQQLKPGDERINTLISQLQPRDIKANVTLKLRQTNYMYANLITVAGDFNDWDTLMHPFIKQNGEWVCKLQLPPGRYHYKLIIDGIWTLDPENPVAELDDDENFNSVLVVDESK